MSKIRATDPVQAVIDQYAGLLSLSAHELRTAASVVSGYLRMLQMEAKTPLPDRQRKMVDEAAQSCARLVALIGELSDIGTLDDGTAAMAPETFDLFDELDGVASRVHEAEDRGVRLQLAGASTGAWVAGNRQRLGTAFEALLRAMLREQPTAVTVVADRRLVKTPGSSAAAVVIVACEAAIERAYDGVKQSFDENRGGMGLSLPIARRVIERAGGRIWSPTPANAEDRGLRSAVVVSIPLNDRDAIAP